MNDEWRLQTEAAGAGGEIVERLASLELERELFLHGGSELRDARSFAARLEDEGLPVARRWVAWEERPLDPVAIFGGLGG